MKLQYQLSNGAWIDCANRSDEFLARCIKNHPFNDESAVLAALASGKTVRNDREDWYSNCRDSDAISEKTATRVTEPKVSLRCRCGNTGHAGSYPFSTLPESGKCDDCV